jgi:NADPH:quinone reductase-like Zn-dependent oxidoreductase/NAD(P)-dependent dehydrogenase (short-subunit alcohol dehydrogenase family)/SAM-dependent methyltransferase/acyl carrier protein
MLTLRASDAVFPAAGFIAMAVEAAKRVHQESPISATITGYSLRRVDVKAALRVPEDDTGIEVILSMDLGSSATPKTLEWTKFTIVSVTRDSSKWTEHCTGQVKVETGLTVNMNSIGTEMDARTTDISAWYNRFAEIGIGYGPAFQVLSDVRADPHKNTATATVQLDRTVATIEGGESIYPVHPITLDAAFQLGLISCYGGQLERANTAFVPVHISHMRLNATEAGPSHGTITAQGRTQGLRSAYVRSQVCDANGNLIVEVDTLRCISYKESKSAKQLASAIPFNSPFARLSWKPDLRKLSNEQARSLFPPPSENKAGQMGLETADMICCLVVAEIYKQLGNDMATWPHSKGELGHWLSWIRKCVEEDERPNMVEARQLPSNERCHLLQSLYEEAGDKPEARAAKALHENIMDILHERKTGIDVLVSEGLLTALYEVGHMVAGSHPQLYNLLDSMGHANPNLRILEIGGGTGAATRVAMKALSGPNGIKRYADYTFTDVSAGFITFAKDFMSEYHDIHYSVLDIDTNPLEHGYKPEYDVVIACEAIHATPNMDKTLSNCRSLLKPGGKLVLVETVRMRVLAGLLYGTLTGYWLGASDDRTEGPFMNVETWDSRLRSAGFSGTDIVLDDYDYPHVTTSVLVSTRLEGHADTNGVNDLGNGSTQIYLLHDDKGAPPLLQEISTALERRGAVVNIAPINETSGDINSSSRVVVFLGPQNDLFEADDSRFGLFQRLVRGSHSMVWVTSSGIIRGRDPRGAFMIGLLRVIATENPAGRFLSIDLDSQNFDTRDEALVRSIVDVEASLQHEEPDQHYDHEYVWQDGALWISRFVPDAELNTYADNPESMGMQETDIASLAGQGPLRASFETAGLLSSLYFRPYTELLNSVQDDYIDVKVAAVGLNWKDLALVTGKFDGVSNDLSSEYAGVITKVGANVTELSVGDRVYGVGRGHFGNYTRVPAAFACKLQPGDNSVEMATMPLVYMTAVYALEHIAHLRRGQKILIQSATGGLGLAAIQLARYKHADIFVTAGTTDKMDFLKNSMGFQVDRVFASRDPVALAQASRETGKNGFDVILCTASGGDLLHASLAALAPMGHLIDLSRVDVIESRDIGLEVFQRNASLTSFDLNLVLDNDTELGSQLMKTVDELYRAGSIGPIHPSTVCDITHLDEVMLRFSKGTHIGKHVISFENPDSTIKLTKQPPRTSFDPSARYVVVGGFGGLGRAIILWMVERGARSFIVFSRRGVRTPEARILVRDLAARGIHLDVVPCDVSSQSEVEEAFKKVSEASHPIKGVIHAALFLSDLSFDKLTAAKWKKGIEAKTLGTINLHKATESLPLDFFLMITSTESVWAPATQAAYIAATNFQESFSRYRRSLGLPASAVALGLVKDIVSDFKNGSFGTEEMYARNQALTMTGYQVLSQLEPAFLNQLPSHWIGAKDDPLSAASLFTCLNPVALAKLTSPQTPRWHSDPRVSLIVHAMNDARRHALNDGENGAGDGDSGGASSASAVAGLRRAFSEAVKQGEEARSSTVTLVMDGITKTIAEMLFIDVLNVNPERSIAEHGVDSLIAAELRHWFHQALGADLQMQDLLDAQASIKVLSASIVDKALKKED